MSQSTPKSICGEWSFLQQNFRPHQNMGGEKLTQEGEMYACKICGNVVKVVASGAGVLVCCGQPMELVED
jgi:superoxide reductase